MKTALVAYDLSELKLVYRALHAALPAEPALVDSQLLADLQLLLQQAAKSAGVDATDHRAWTQWLRH